MPYLARFFLLILTGSIVLLTCGYSQTISSKTEKLTPDELVARHLLSLGTPEARTAIKNRLMDGDAEVAVKRGSVGHMKGTASFVSEGSMVRIAMNLFSQTYPGEQLVYNGKKVRVGSIRPGIRSELSGFINDYGTVLLEEGILAGTTTTHWCLFGYKERKVRLEYLGLNKVDGVQLHALRYNARKGDFKIDFFFEPNSFRHVQTQYTLKVSIQPDPSTPNFDKIRAPYAYWRGKEVFSNFSIVDGVTLPHSYKLTLTYEGVSEVLEIDYTMTFNKVQHNQQLEATTFTVR
jgi:hypothetical protein